MKISDKLVKYPYNWSLDHHKGNKLSSSAENTIKKDMKIYINDRIKTYISALAYETTATTNINKLQLSKKILLLPLISKLPTSNTLVLLKYSGNLSFTEKQNLICDLCIPVDRNIIPNKISILLNIRVKPLHSPRKELVLR